MAEFLNILGNIINWILTVGAFLLALYTFLKKTLPIIKVNTCKYYQFEFINQGTISQTIIEVGLILKWNKKLPLTKNLERELKPTQINSEPFDIEGFKHFIEENKFELPFKCRQYVKTSDGKTFKSKKLVITKSSLEEIARWKSSLKENDRWK